MSTFYENKKSLVKRMIDKRGETCSIVKRTSVDSVDKPWENTTTSSPTSANVVFLPHTAFVPGSIYQDGTTMKIGDKQMLSYGVVPELGDVVVRVNGERWIVAYVFDLDPGGSDLLFDCGVRR